MLRARFALTGLVALPIALATALVSPGLVHRAEGCSGGPPYLWEELTSFGNDPAAPTDAVFVLAGLASGGSPPSGPEFELTSSSGSAIPGITSSVLVDSSASEISFAVVFKPNAPLAAENSYQMRWREFGGEFSAPVQITTTSVPGAKPAAPTIDASFARVHVLRGNLVSCDWSYLGCAFGATFYDTEVIAPAMELTWTYPSSAVSSYSVTKVQGVPGKGIPNVVGSIESGMGGVTSSRTVVFDGELPEYCVRLVTRDLTDDSETTSPEVCVSAAGSPGQVPSTTPLLDAELAKCSTPPPGLGDKWCKVHPGLQGCPPAPAVDASTSSNGAGETESGDASGCAVGHAAAGSGPEGFLYAAILLGLARRARGGVTLQNAKARRLPRSRSSPSPWSQRSRLRKAI